MNTTTQVSRVAFLHSLYSYTKSPNHSATMSNCCLSMQPQICICIHFIRHAMQCTIPRPMNPPARQINPDLNMMPSILEKHLHLINQALRPRLPPLLRRIQIPPLLNPILHPPKHPPCLAPNLHLLQPPRPPIRPSTPYNLPSTRPKTPIAPRNPRDHIRNTTLNLHSSIDCRIRCRSICNAHIWVHPDAFLLTEWVVCVNEAAF